MSAYRDMLLNHASNCLVTEHDIPAISLGVGEAERLSPVTLILKQQNVAPEQRKPVRQPLQNRDQVDYKKSLPDINRSLFPVLDWGE